MNDDEKLYDRKVRWQETRIKQFSHANYIILTLSLAIFGFAVSLITKDDFLVKTQSMWFFGTHLLSLICFAVSIYLGVCCAYNRLKDFRKTAKIALLKYRQRNSTETPEIKELRCETNKLGEYSWCFLKWQIRTFAVGFLFLILALVPWLLSNLCSLCNI